MITKEKMPWSFLKFFHTFFKEMYRDQFGLKHILVNL